jgi:YadA-like C-terminal region./Haemagglutinin.
MNKKIVLMVGVLSVFSVNVMATKIEGRLVDNTSYIYSQDKNLSVSEAGGGYDNLMPPRDINDVILYSKLFDINLNKDLVDMNSATFEAYLDEDQPDLDANPDADEVARRTVINGNGITITKEKFLDPRDNPPHDDSERDIYKTVSLTNDGLDNGGNRITNVKNGENGTDAVNVSQLKEVESKISNIGQTAISTANHYTDLQVAKVGASANALGGLKYLDYDPNDKWSFATSIGHYKNASAVAIGASYQPNENVMIHAGSALDGNSSFNIGASFKVGSQDPQLKMNKWEMARQIKDLQADNADLRAELQEIKLALQKIR